MDDKEIILGQYKVYSDAKEQFINRHFATNRFYFAFSFMLFVMVYVFYALSPGILQQIITSAFGIAVSVLWWLNIDSYQFLVKIKYSRILEYLETKLPEAPYNKEFKEMCALRKSKNIMFLDFQKGFTGLVFLAFVTIFICTCVNALIDYKVIPLY